MSTRNLYAALRWLVDDITDKEEHRNHHTGDVYDSVQQAMNALKEHENDSADPFETYLYRAFHRLAYEVAGYLNTEDPAMDELSNSFSRAEVALQTYQKELAKNNLLLPLKLRGWVWNNNLVYNATIRCPYCQIQQKVVIKTNTSYSQHYCDNEVGGCDKLFLLQLSNITGNVEYGTVSFELKEENK